MTKNNNKKRQKNNCTISKSVSVPCLLRCPIVVTTHKFSSRLYLLIKFGVWVHLVNTVYHILYVGHCDQILT